MRWPGATARVLIGLLSGAAVGLSLAHWMPQTAATAVGIAQPIGKLWLSGLPMTVVSADGLNVRPVTVDEFQIGNAETYDVIIQPAEDKAFTLVAESIDRSGMARATFAPRLTK